MTISTIPKQKMGHGGAVAGRRVRDQAIYATALTNTIFTVKREKPTGTVVSLAINSGKRSIDGFVCFPRWIRNDPQKTVAFRMTASI